MVGVQALILMVTTMLLICSKINLLMHQKGVLQRRGGEDVTAVHVVFRRNEARMLERFA